MFKPGNETKSVLLDIVGLLGYLGIGIALWQLTMSLSADHYICPVHNLLTVTNSLVYDESRVGSIGGKS